MGCRCGCGHNSSCNTGNVSRLVDNGNGSFTHISGNGTMVNFQTGGDSNVSIIDNEDGTFTFDNNGVLTVVGKKSSMILNNNGSITFTGNDGSQFTFDSGSGTPSQVVYNGDETYTHTSGDGTQTLITTATMVQNPNGSYTYSKGIVNFTIPQPVVSTFVNNGDGTFTHNNGGGQTTIIREGKEETVTSLAYNSTAKRLSYTNELGVVINLDLSNLNNASQIGSTLVGNRIATHTSGDGVVRTINETVTSFTNNNNGTYTYVNEAGVSTIFNSSAETLTSLTYNSITGQLTYTAENSIPSIINLPVENFLNGVAFNSTTKELTLTLLNNSDFVVDLSSLANAAASETITAIVDNNNASFTYTNESGGTVTYTEKNTTLVQNGSNLTYTSENGTETTISLCNVCPSLKLEKIAKSKKIVKVGDIVKYVFILTNDGNVDMTNVSVIDPTATVSGSSISLTAGSVDSTTFSATYVVTAADATRGYVVNTASATANSANGSTSTFASDVVEVEPISVVFYIDGDNTEANASTAIQTAINNSDPIGYTNGSGTTTIFDANLTFQELEAQAIAVYGVGTTVDPTTYKIFPANNSLVNTPICTEKNLVCGIYGGVEEYFLMGTSFFDHQNRLNPKATITVINDTNIAQPLEWLFSAEDGSQYRLKITGLDPSTSLLYNRDIIISNAGAVTPYTFNVEWTLIGGVRTSSPNGCIWGNPTMGVIIDDMESGTVMSNIVRPVAYNVAGTSDGKNVRKERVSVIADGTSNNDHTFPPTGDYFSQPSDSFTADSASSTTMGIRWLLLWGDLQPNSNHAYSYDITIQSTESISLYPIHRSRTWVEAEYLCNYFIEATDVDNNVLLETQINF